MRKLSFVLLVCVFSFPSYAQQAVKEADGANVTLGAKADAAAGTGTVTAMAIFKQLHLDMLSGVAAPGAAGPASVIGWGALGSGATAGLERAVINCDLHVFKHITSATDTLAVQGVASQAVYICGVLGQAAGTATFFLENTASTNANCSSSNTQIAGVSTMVANGSTGFYSSTWGGLKNTAGNGLCINSTGTGGVDVDIWYAQF